MMDRLGRCAAGGMMMAAVFWSLPASVYAAPPAAAVPDAAPPQTVPEAPQPGEGSGTSQPPLSDRLDRSGGVIRPPPGIDPEIHHAPPPTGPGSMPILRPPGTPGGDPDVQPK